MESTTDSNPPAGTAATPAAFRPLNVRDALQYLDRVKQQFAQEYQVYDHFLNIMKDFKTQNIDTPGVIDRVSTLFRGHPSLIQGFNTFLPPGYRIECSVSAPNEEGASNTITVTTPMGVTTRTQDVTGVEAREFVRSQPRASPAATPAAPSSVPASPSIPSPGPAPAPAPAWHQAGPAPSAPALPAATAQPSSGSSLPVLPAGPTQTPAAPSTSTVSSPNPLPTPAAPRSLPPVGAGTARISTTPITRLSSPPAVIPPYSGHRREAPAIGRPGVTSNHSGTASPLSQSIGQPQQPLPRFLPALPSVGAPPGGVAAARTRSDEGEFAAVNSAASAIQGAANASGASSGNAPSGSTTPGGSLVPPPPTTTPIMEFNHAINYVNKIKNRFTKDPETYKTFLEILQTYQKEARPIQEVYTQVTALFHSAPDLLDEFKAFLPDTTGADHPSNFGPPSTADSHSLTGIGSLLRGKQQGKDSRGTPGRDSASAGGKRVDNTGYPQEFGGNSLASNEQKKTGALGHALTGSPMGGSEEKKKRAAPGMGERAKAKRAKTHHAMPLGESPMIGSAAGASGSHPHSKVDQRQSDAAASGYHSHGHSHSHSQYQQQPPPQYQQQTHAQQLPLHQPVHQVHAPYGAPPPNFPGAPRMQSAYETYLSTHRTPALVQAEEFSFFDRVKKYLDDRAAYTEFLKLLNLFTQEIIDVNTLLEKSLLFIGGSDELVGAFKDLVGWDSVKDGRIEGEDWIIDNEPVLERPKLELHSMKSFGPSYRKLPDSEIDLACSARDSLEWSVLNDEWVAFATWASEGSGAHRKNIYEDALYNSEQERHWYSFHIESNLRTIAHLEPIAARIALMNAEERNTYRLEPGLGGDTPSVYERIVKKVYGKDQGYEILQALCDNPAVAVPIVLARLKQKDEEWKRAEREWNKVWRDVDSKNFYRALDHQAIPFKALDKKTATTSKSLITEIETLRRDKHQKRFDLESVVPAPLRPLHQFELGMVDRDVLFDVLKLSFSFLDRDQSGTSAPERARVEAFLRLFVPLLFGVPHSDMEANLAHSDETPENEDDEAPAGGEVHSDLESNGVEPMTNGTSSNHKNGVNKKGGAADLRKRLLTHAAATAARTPGRPVSRGGSPTPGNGSVASTSASGGEDGAVNGVSAGIILGEQTWIQLNEIRKSEAAKQDEPRPTRRFNFFANSTFYCLVRIIHTLYHRLLTFKKLCAERSAQGTRRLSPFSVELGLSVPVPFIDSGDNPADHYYEHALDLAEKLFDGDLDQATYEEHLRYMVGVKAYPLFTMDKLISAIIKHIHTINGDSKCHDLVTLLEKDRARDYTTPRQQIAYRMEAESIVGADENLYRIEWIPDVGALTIQFLHREDLTLDDSYGDQAKMHASWVASYALTSATEGVGAQVQAPLLKRNRVLSATEDPVEFDLSPGLEAKVLDDSYQLLFVANSEDYLHRRRPTTDTSALMTAIREKRSNKFDGWLKKVSPAEASAEVAEVVVGMAKEAEKGDEDVVMES